MATMPMYDQQDIFTPAINSALNYKQTDANVSQINTGIQKMEAEIEDLMASANLKDHEARRINYDIPRIIADTSLKNAGESQSLASARLSHSQSDYTDLNKELLKMSTREKAVMAKIAEYKLSVFDDPDTSRNAILNEVYKGSSIPSSLQGISAGLTKDVMSAYRHILDFINRR
jgi:hypothetical protein